MSNKRTIEEIKNKAKQLGLVKELEIEDNYQRIANKIITDFKKTKKIAEHYKKKLTQIVFSQNTKEEKFDQLLDVICSITKKEKSYLAWQSDLCYAFVFDTFKGFWDFEELTDSEIEKVIDLIFKDSEVRLDCLSCYNAEHDMLSPIEVYELYANDNSYECCYQTLWGN